MKKILIPTICILLSVLLIATVPTEAEAAIYHDTVRLHILAPSDSREDQTLKLEIRDRVLEKYGEQLSRFENVNTVKNEINKVIGEIERDCEAWICELGYEYSVSAELTEEWYGTREYSNFTLPAGQYTSLKIVLGEGEGQNWWCVMYPPLCLDAALGKPDTAYSEEETALISKSGYKVKFKLLEVVTTVFDGFRE